MKLLIQKYAQFRFFRRGSGNSSSNTFLWRRCVLVITTAQLHSTKPELRLRFSDLHPACRISAIVRISDNGPWWKQSKTPFVGQPYHKNNSSSPSTFFNKNASYAFFYYFSKLHCLIFFTSWVIGQYVYRNFLFSKLWHHKFWNWFCLFNQAVFLNNQNVKTKI